MKRRLFLKRAGAAIAGGAGTLSTGGAHALGQARGSAPDDAGQSSAPRVLLTSAGTDLGRSLAVHLGPQYGLRLTDGPGRSDGHALVTSELDHGPRTAELVRHVDAIVHLAEPPEGATDAERIDHRTRRTYNLLQAAVQEHVRLVVYLSSLEILAAYPADLAVSEDWLPAPAAVAEPLSAWLGEFACREFAREGLRTVVLRLGKVARPGRASEIAADLPWVDERDVAASVGLALETGLGENAASLGLWSVFHIAADSSGGRFPLKAARERLGFQPRYVRVES